MRRGVPDDPLALLESFPGGLTTQEIAQLLTRGNDAPDRVEAETAMLATRRRRDGNSDAARRRRAVDARRSVGQRLGLC